MKKIFMFALMAALSLWAFSMAAQPANDNFTNSDQVSGTNITYSGTFTGATLEPGELQLFGSNTVWMSWVAPATGYTQVSLAPAPQSQYYVVFTGNSVTNLSQVPLRSLSMNGNYRFTATAGTAYHFQFSGGISNFTFYLQLYPFRACTNDNFSDAILRRVDSVMLGPDSILGATMEPGEPPLLGAVPQGSIWWIWQSQVWCTYTVDASASTASNFATAVYTGNSVDTLSRVAQGTNMSYSFSAQGGQSYYVTAVAPTNTSGNISISLNASSVDTSAHVIPGNLLQEPSWEGTGIVDAQYWKWTNGLNGYVNETQGAVDGTTWPVLGGQSGVWQDIPTIPGHTYAIRFAYKIGGQISGGSGDGLITVWWSGIQLGLSDIPGAEGGFWHWDNYTVTASNTTSRVCFVCLGRNTEMDAFSVLDATAPPAIVTQPVSASSLAGGTVVLDVGASGTAPLCYQWYFNNAALSGQTNNLLTLSSVTTNQTGNYFAIVTNNFGAATSAVASVQVNVPMGATILVQPYGDTVPVGGYFNFTVVAATSTPPLTYQWFFNGAAIGGATNQNLSLTDIQTTNAGTYTVEVQDASSTAFSFPATLVVDTNAVGGGTINFANRFISDTGTNSLPDYDVDGTTLLSGSNYVAQLYAGPSLALLRPAGQATPYQTSSSAGLFIPETITLGNVAPGSNAVVQVRAWDSAFGSSFEAARAMGGRFGESQIFTVAAGGETPVNLNSLQSFSLQAGSPYFEVARIQFVERQPPNTIVWALQGEPGYIYAIEKSTGLQTRIWQPFITVTNVTGTVNFSDTSDSGSAVVLYRARILN